MAYAWAVGAVALSTLLCRLMSAHFEVSDLIMVYLLGVAFVATRFGRGPSALAALSSVAAFDFFFVPPRLTFAVADTHYLLTFAVMLGVALLISSLAVRAREQAEAARQLDAERLRNTLLSSVSHDLRTPLAAITGAASGLLSEASLASEARAELARTVYEEAARLNRQVGNLLDMTRLESGPPRLEREWQSFEEIIGAAVGRVERQLEARALRIELPADLPLVAVDALLVEQLLFNLLDNALKHTPPQASIEVSAQSRGSELMVTVANDGPPLQQGEEMRVFEKFYRRNGAPRGGFGLGLAICRGVVEAHGGRIWAENRKPGVAFHFTLPTGGQPPAAPDAPDELA